MFSQRFAAAITFPSALLSPLASIISMQKLMKSQVTWLESGFELCSSRAYSLLCCISSVNSQGNTNYSGNSQLDGSFYSKNQPTSLHACICRCLLALCPLEASERSVLLEMTSVSRRSPNQPELPPLFRIFSVGRQPHCHGGDEFADEK